MFGSHLYREKFHSSTECLTEEQAKDLANWISIILGKQKVTAVKVIVGIIKGVCSKVKPWEPDPGGNMKPRYPIIIFINLKERERY